MAHRGRRVSAIMEVKDLELLQNPAPIKPGPDDKDAEETRNEFTLQSGLMLNHCILYRELSFETPSLNLQAADYFPTTKLNLTAFIASHIQNKQVTEEAIHFKSAQEYLSTKVSGHLQNSQSILWIHVTDIAIVPLLFATCHAHPLALKTFYDNLPRTTFNFFDKNSFVCSISSFSLEENGVICALKLFIYIKDNLIITQERRTHAALKELILQEGQPSSPRLIKNSGSPHSNEEEKNGVSKMSNEQMMDVVPRVSAYNGRIFSKLKEVMTNSTTHTRLENEGVAYVIYEAFVLMLDITTPVVNFYSTQQLKLHDTVHVRETPPTHSEGNAILDRVDFIKAGFQLMNNLIERCTTCLLDSKERLNERLPGEWVTDLISIQEHALDVVGDMDRELDRITETINGTISRRNEQISIVLSLVATIFLPLTFIAGVFGMNFEKGGIIVWMLRMRNGTDWFWGSCAVCCVICIAYFVYKGWLDMLGSVRRGGRTMQLSSSTSKFSLTDIFNRLWG